MVASLAPVLDGWSGAPALPSGAPLTGMFECLPDPVQLHAEGIALQSQDTAPHATISEWCERAHECLQFLASTDPARIWIWQEQVFPLLLALASKLSAKHALENSATHGRSVRGAFLDPHPP
jgi:hypothetical protein